MDSKIVFPIFPYPGGKRKELKIIQKYAPSKWTIFVDAFGGSGCVSMYFRQMEPKKQIFYNDFNKSLTKLLGTFQDEKTYKKFIDDFNALPATQEKFKELQKDLDNPLNLFYCMKYGFRGNPKSGVINAKKGADGKLDIRSTRVDPESAEKYHHVMKEIKIKNANAIDLITHCKDNPNIFIYLDPPYLQKETCNEMYSRFEMEDLHKIMQFMKDPTVKAKIMLHIDFSGWTYDQLKDQMKHYYPSNYSMSHGDGTKYHKRYQMIACNYD